MRRRIAIALSNVALKVQYPFYNTSKEERRMRTNILALTVMALFLAFMSTKASEVEPVKDSHDFVYEGVDVGLINLLSITKETRYKTKMRDATCYNEVPYTEEVCGNETRYRQECRDEPSYEDCRDVNDTVCRNETRWEQECRRGPSRNVCRHEPGRRVCRDLPPKRVCQNQGGRQVCRMKNGGQQCKTAPGRSVCRDVPGENICRDVPRNHRVCRNTTRRECTTIPSQNVCEDVPYQEYVCKDVTKIKHVPYACKKPVQIPYTVKVKNNAAINFDFQVLDEDVRSKFKIKLDGTKLSLKTKNESKNAFYSYAIEEKKINTGDLVNNIEASYEVYFVKKSTLLKPIKEKISLIRLSKRYVRISIGGIDKKSTTVRLVIKNGNSVLINTIVDLKKYHRDNPSDRNTFQLAFSDFGQKLLRRKRYSVEVKMVVSPEKADTGKLLNDISKDKLEVTKLFESIKPERK